MNGKVWHFKELISTNDYAIEHIDSLADRDVIIADIQTHGKGKQGRIWHSSNSNNVYLSIVLKENSSLAKALPKLTLFSANMVAEFIETNYEQAKQQVQLRKPNDVLVKHQKIAGVLADASWIGNQARYAIVGIGINLNMTQKELSLIDQVASSLNLICGEYIPKESFISSFVDFYFLHLDTFLSNNYHQDQGSTYFKRFEDSMLPSKQAISIKDR
jgi:BirA family transcriptional regulator, biotin operon repressor / biotin---[acetyl-CoA-carboxylase] ligase